MQRSPAPRYYVEEGTSNSPHPLKREAYKPWIHLLAGASGGFATAIMTSPLDVLRTRLQSDLYRAPTPASAVSHPKRLVDRVYNHLKPSRTTQIIHSIYQVEGWPAFFRGLGPSLAGVVPATAIKFYVYGNCKRIGADILGYSENSSFVHAQAAICAGIATATVTNPIWLVKTRMQLDKARKHSDGPPNRQYRNSIDCVRQVLRYEGISGLYRGLSASYLGSVETALHLVLYERLKRILHLSLEPTEGTGTALLDELRHWISTSGAAGFAKLAAGLIAYPHEVVRTRLRQAPVKNGSPKYTGLLQCFRTIGKEEGLAGLYGGLTPHMLRSLPSAVITLGVYEFILRTFGT